MGKGSRLAACTTGQERSRVNEIQIPLRRKPSRSVAPYGLPTPGHCAVGCRLWATSHANSDKVPLFPSCFLSRFVLLTPSFSISFTTFNVLPTYHPRHFLPILSMSFSFYLFFSVSLVLFGRLSPLAVSQGHPNPYGPEPGNICPRDICVLIESPISSLIERTIGRFFLRPRFSLFLSDSRSNRSVLAGSIDTSTTRCGSFAKCKKRYLPRDELS